MFSKSIDDDYDDVTTTKTDSESFRTSNYQY